MKQIKLKAFSKENLQAFIELEGNLFLFRSPYREKYLKKFPVSEAALSYAIQRNGFKVFDRFFPDFSELKSFLIQFHPDVSSQEAESQVDEFIGNLPSNRLVFYYEKIKEELLPQKEYAKAIKVANRVLENGNFSGEKDLKEKFEKLISEARERKRLEDSFKKIEERVTSLGTIQDKALLSQTKVVYDFFSQIGRMVLDQERKSVDFYVDFPDGKKWVVKCFHVVPEAEVSPPSFNLWKSIGLNRVKRLRTNLISRADRYHGTSVPVFLELDQFNPRAISVRTGKELRKSKMNDLREELAKKFNAESSPPQEFESTEKIKVGLDTSRIVSTEV